MAISLCPHSRQNRFDHVDGAKEVRLELVAHDSQSPLGSRKLFNGTNDSWTPSAAMVPTSNFML